LRAQLAKAQGALVEVFAQWLKQGPVFGEGAQDALGFDHRNGRLVGELKAAIVLHQARDLSTAGQGAFAMGGQQCRENHQRWAIVVEGR
jgi:hypothetical protein